jgi:hypothetical protein
MPVRTATLVLSLVAVACGSRVPGPGTGVRGVVMVGPQCPVQNVASACPDEPFHGEVRAMGSDGSSGSATTEANGSFRMDLAPGTYELVAVTDGPGPPTAIPLTVTVRSGAYTRVSLQVDTGIR